MDKTKILIADDHAVVRLGLSALLDAEDDFLIVGQAEDGRSAVRKTLSAKPDVVIMDLMMPVLNGIAATREIKAASPKTKILILTTSSVSDDLSHAIDAGADGVVVKSEDCDRLLEVLRAILRGERVIAPEVAELISRDPPAPQLTPRQMEILDSITRGLTNAEIALQLGIGHDRVKAHVNAIFQKLGAANRAEAVAIATRKRLL